jgi:putative ABC transport system permease protein
MKLSDEIRESALIAWAALRANKLRSTLTTLGVVIGIVTVTLMGTAINGINTAFRQSISTMGADVLFIGRFPWMSFEDWRAYRNRPEITLAQARELERSLTSAVAVAPQADGNGTVLYNRRRASGVWINGNTEQSLSIRGLSIATGRWFTTSDIASARPVCVLGSYLAEGFFPHESPLGKRIRVNDSNYEVIGVIEPLGSFLGGWNQDNQVVIPITRFQSDLQRHPDYTISVKARSASDLPEVSEEVRAIMRRIRKVPPGAPDNFAINQQDVFIQFFLAFGGTIGLVGLFITGLSLLVGGIGIMNIMFVSVTERTKEIGIRKALGAKKRTILIQFLIEAASLTLGAGLLAISITWPATLAIDHYTRFAARMSWWIVAIALLVSILTGIVAGFIPALRAARMNPVDALRAD